MVTTDPAPVPLREDRGSKQRALKRKGPTPFSTQPAQIQQRHSSNLSPLPRTALEKKIFSILMETKIKKKEEERKQDTEREGLHSTGSYPPQPENCFVLLAQEKIAFLL